MRATFTLSLAAQQDIEGVVAHLAASDLDVARRFPRAVFETAEDTTLFPRRFPLASDVFGLKLSARRR